MLFSAWRHAFGLVVGVAIATLRSAGAGRSWGGCSVPGRPDASTPISVALGVVALLGARRRTPARRR